MGINRVAVPLATLVVGVGSTAAAGALDTGEDHLRAIEKIAENYRDRLGDDGIERLSSGMRQLIHVGEKRAELTEAAEAMTRRRTNVALGPRRARAAWATTRTPRRTCSPVSPG